MNQGDTLEEASPVTDVVVESNEDFYDQSYVNETEKTAAEVCSLTAPMLNGLQSSSLWWYKNTDILAKQRICHLTDSFVTVCL